MGVFTAIACLFGTTAILSFVNDRYLGLQTDIGLLLLAVLTRWGCAFWKALFLRARSMGCANSPSRST